jgi:hypothetical protein
MITTLLAKDLSNQTEASDNKNLKILSQRWNKNQI